MNITYHLLFFLFSLSSLPAVVRKISSMQLMVLFILFSLSFFSSSFLSSSFLSFFFSSSFLCSSSLLPLKTMISYYTSVALIMLLYEHNNETCMCYIEISFDYLQQQNCLPKRLSSSLDMFSDKESENNLKMCN